MCLSPGDLTNNLIAGSAAPGIWAAVGELNRDGRVRAVGVADFPPAQLPQLPRRGCLLSREARRALRGNRLATGGRTRHRGGLPVKTTLNGHNQNTLATTEWRR